MAPNLVWQCLCHYWSPSNQPILVFLVFTSVHAASIGVPVSQLVTHEQSGTPSQPRLCLYRIFQASRALKTSQRQASASAAVSVVVPAGALLAVTVPDGLAVAPVAAPAAFTFPQAQVIIQGPISVNFGQAQIVTAANPTLITITTPELSPE